MSDAPSLAVLQERLGHRFAQEDRLRLALTHKSFANEHRVSTHNERLEFLGDAVLSLVVSEHLMEAFPDASEGDLSRIRAAVVSEPSLAAAARDLGLGAWLLLGRGEEQTGGRDKDSLLADSIEALIAAVYLDGGKAAAASFIMRFFAERITATGTSGGTQDYKTRLQELCQERLKQLPEYRIVSETGPDHCKEFHVELRIQGRITGQGVGKSKKEAEQRAAKEALADMQQES